MVDNIETVGADLCVYPFEHKNKFDNTLNIKGRELNPKGRALEPKGRTHGSAPTGYKYNRRSLRLKYYDYSRAGFYFITICAQNKEHLFGSIVEGIMDLNEAGEMVNTLWFDIVNDFSNVSLHEFVIMPNHIHGIIEIKNNENCVGVPLVGTLDMSNMDGIYNKRAPTRDAPTVGNIIGVFKSRTTNTYIKMVKNGTLPPFNKRIWQRNYYEHVIRDDVDYERVATYTINNPKTWDDDVLSKP